MAFLSSDQLSNPMIFGAVAPKTAEMLVEAGDALTKRIEAQNQQFDAQLKAPQIGEYYANALTRIAAGDVSGFSDIGKASAMAVGNPILRDMFKDADNVAGGLYKSYMDKEALTQRLAMQEELQDERLKAQEKLIDKRAGVQRQHEADLVDRQLHGQDWQRYNTELSNWNIGDRQARAEHARQKAEIEMRNNAELEMQKEYPGYKPNIMKVPEYIPQAKPEPPRPTATRPRTYDEEGVELPSRDAGIQPGGLFGGDAEGRGPVVGDGRPMANADPLQGQGDIMDTPAPELQGLPPRPRVVAEAPVAAAAGVAGAAGAAAAQSSTIGEAPTTPSAEDAEAMEQAGLENAKGVTFTNSPNPPSPKPGQVFVAPKASHPSEAGLNKDGKYVIPMGQATYYVTPDMTEESETSKTMETHYGKVTKSTKIKPEFKEEIENYMKVMGKIKGSDESDFLNRATHEMLVNRKPVTMKQVDAPGGKGYNYQVQSGGQPMMVINPAFAEWLDKPDKKYGEQPPPEKIPMPNVSGKLGDAWIEAESLKTALQGRVGVVYTPDGTTRKHADMIQLNNVARKNTTLEKVNADRVALKAEPLTLEQVNEFAKKNGIQYYASTPAEKSAEESRLTKSLEGRGIKEPVAAATAKEQDERAAQFYREDVVLGKKELDKIEDKYHDAMARGDTSSASTYFEQMREKQRKIERRMSWLERNRPDFLKSDARKELDRFYSER